MTSHCCMAMLSSPQKTDLLTGVKPVTAIEVEVLCFGGWGAPVGLRVFFFFL